MHLDSPLSPLQKQHEYAINADNLVLYRLVTYVFLQIMHSIHTYISSAEGLLLTLSLQINWRMRVTLNDGRAMTGQMLAFDKVCLLIALILLTLLNRFIAHESCTRRYRRIPTRQTEAEQVCRPWCKRF